MSSDFQGPGCGGNTPSLCTAALDRRRGGHGRDAQFPAEFMVCCFFVHLSVFCFFVGDLQFFFLLLLLTALLFVSLDLFSCV